MTAWSDVADAVQAFTTATGVVVGGVFTYFKFVKDRIYRPRVDIGIECTRMLVGARPVIACQLSLHNMGSAKLSLIHEGTALMIYPLEIDPRPLHAARWSDDSWGVADIFAKHDWLESGETVRDEAVLSTDGDADRAYRIEVRIVVRHPAPRRRSHISITGARVLAGGPSASPGDAHD